MYPTDGYGREVVLQEPLRDDDLNGETARLSPAFDYSSDEETVWGKAGPPLRCVSLAQQLGYGNTQYRI